MSPNTSSVIFRANKLPRIEECFNCPNEFILYSFTFGGVPL